MMVKPHTSTIWKYAAKLAETNGSLNNFLLHQQNQARQMDELLEILEFVTPVSWQQQMTHHGIDPLQQMIAQFVQFSKCLKSMEQVPTGTNPKRVHNDKNEDMQKPTCKSCKHGTKCTGTEKKYFTKCGKGNHTTNRCLKVHKQLGLPVSDAAKVQF